MEQRGTKRAKYEDDSIDLDRVIACNSGNSSFYENISKKQWRALMQTYYNLNYLPSLTQSLRFKRKVFKTLKEHEDLTGIETNEERQEPDLERHMFQGNCEEDMEDTYQGKKHVNKKLSLKFQSNEKDKTGDFVHQTDQRQANSKGADRPDADNSSVGKKSHLTIKDKNTLKITSLGIKRKRTSGKSIVERNIHSDIAKTDLKRVSTIEHELNEKEDKVEGEQTEEKKSEKREDQREEDNTENTNKTKRKESKDNDEQKLTEERVQDKTENKNQKKREQRKDTDEQKLTGEKVQDNRKSKNENKREQRQDNNEQKLREERVNDNTENKKQEKREQKKDTDEQTLTEERVADNTENKNQKKREQRKDTDEQKLTRERVQDKAENKNQKKRGQRKDTDEQTLTEERVADNIENKNQKERGQRKDTDEQTLTEERVAENTEIKNQKKREEREDNDKEIRREVGDEERLNYTDIYENKLRKEERKEKEEGKKDVTETKNNKRWRRGRRKENEGEKNKKRSGEIENKKEEEKLEDRKRDKDEIKTEEIKDNKEENRRNGSVGDKKEDKNEKRSKVIVEEWEEDGKSENQGKASDKMGKEKQKENKDTKKKNRRKERDEDNQENRNNITPTKMKENDKEKKRKVMQKEGLEDKKEDKNKIRRTESEKNKNEEKKDEREDDNKEKIKGDERNEKSEEYQTEKRREERTQDKKGKSSIEEDKDEKEKRGEEIAKEKERESEGNRKEKREGESDKESVEENNIYFQETNPRKRNITQEQTRNEKLTNSKKFHTDNDKSGFPSTDARNDVNPPAFGKVIRRFNNIAQSTNKASQDTGPFADNALDKLAELTGKTLFYLFECLTKQSTPQCVKNQSFFDDLECVQNEKRQARRFPTTNSSSSDNIRNVFKKINEESSNNDDLNLIKMLGNFEDIGDGETISLENMNASIKHEIPEEFFDLAIVSSSAGTLSFGENYTNFFADILRKYNQHCVFKFIHNYVKKESSRKWKAAKFTVKGRCTMPGCPVEVTIQQKVKEKGVAENFFCINFLNDIVHNVGDMKARKFIDKRKEDMYEEFRNNLDLKPASMYRDKLRKMNPDSFSGGNRNDVGKTMNTLQQISSKSKRQCSSLEATLIGVTDLQKKVCEDEIREKKKRVFNGYIHFPTISTDGISLTLVDEGLVRLYHLLADTETFYFDATGSLVTPMKWLKNKDNKPKRILLYALTIEHPSKKVPPIPILEHITSEHNALSIRQAFIRFKELETKVFSCNKRPYRIVTDFSRAIIQAALSEFNGESLSEYLLRLYNVIFKENCIPELPETDRKMYIHICSYHILRIHKENLKKTQEYTESKLHFSQRVIGRLICSTQIDEAVAIVTLFKDICVNKFVNSDVTNALDLIGNFINRTNDVLAENKDLDETEMETESIGYGEATVGIGEQMWSAFWEGKLTETNIDNEIESENSEENKYYMPCFFDTFKNYLQYIIIWSNIIFAKDHAEKPVPLTNAYAELFFKIKKSDESLTNLSLCTFLEKNNQLRLSLQRQYVQRFIIDTLSSKHIHGSKKKSLKNLKSFFFDSNEAETMAPGETNDEDTGENIQKADEEEGWRCYEPPKKKKQHDTYLKAPSKHLSFSKKVNKEKSLPEENEIKDTPKLSEIPRTNIPRNQIFKEEKTDSFQTTNNHVSDDTQKTAFFAFRSNSHLKYSDETGSAKILWDSMTYQEKKPFIEMTPIHNPNTVVCVCRNTYSTSIIQSPMVACDLCQEWYHNKCINVDVAFAEFVPYFVCDQCISRLFYNFFAYVRFSSFDIALGETDKQVDLEELYHQFKDLDDATHKRILYHKFPHVYTENLSKKKIKAISILSNKGITNSYLNCYISAIIQLLLGSSISDLLPSTAELPSDYNKLISSLKAKLRTRSNVALSFEMKERGSKYPLLGKILQTCMNKDYKEKEMVDAAEFLDKFLTTLYNDGNATYNPFESVLVLVQRCSECQGISGEIIRKNIIELHVFDTGGKGVSLESLLWGSFCCDLDKTETQFCKVCCKRATLLNVKSFLKTPDVLLISTNRASSKGHVTKTPIELPEILDLRKHICYNSDMVGSLSTYMISGCVNFKGNSSSSGHYVTHLFSHNDNISAYFDDARFRYVNLDEIRGFNYSPINFDTHVVSYVRLDTIESNCKDKISEEQIKVPCYEDAHLVEAIYFGNRSNNDRYIDSTDLASIFVSGWLNDNIINAFIYVTLPFHVPYISSRFFEDLKIGRISSEIIYQFQRQPNLNSYLCIPINKNSNHWIVAFVYWVAKVILVVDSLGDESNEEVSVVLTFLAKYCSFHNMQPIDSSWSYLYHEGLEKQRDATRDCGIYMLMNVHALFERTFPKYPFSNLTTVKYFIATEASSCLNTLRKQYSSREMESQKSNVESVLMDTTLAVTVNEINFLADFKNRSYKTAIDAINAIAEKNNQLESDANDSEFEEQHINQPHKPDDFVIKKFSKFLRSSYACIKRKINSFCMSKGNEVNFRLLSITSNIPSKSLECLASEEDRLLEEVLGEIDYQDLEKTLQEFEYNHETKKQSKDCFVKCLSSRKFSTFNFFDYFVKPTLMWGFVDSEGLTKESEINYMNVIYGKYHKELLKHEGIVIQNHIFKHLGEEYVIQVTQQILEENYDSVQYLIPRGCQHDLPSGFVSIDFELESACSWTRGDLLQQNRMKNYVNTMLESYPKYINFISIEIPVIEMEKDLYCEILLNTIKTKLLSEQINITLVRMYTKNEADTGILAKVMKKMTNE